MGVRWIKQASVLIIKQPTSFFFTYQLENFHHDPSQVYVQFHELLLKHDLSEMDLLVLHIIHYIADKHY